MLKNLQFFLILISFTFLAAGLGFAQDNARDNETTFENNFDFPLDAGWKYTSPTGGVLYDNGPAFNVPGGGAGGADLSLLESTTLGMSTLGFGHQVSAGNRIADDFTATEQWTIDSIVFFAYQTNGGIPSTITAVNLQIWDGSPDLGTSTVVWGDASTNVMTHTEWSNIYRASETDPSSTARAIMKNTVTVGTTLPAGTYWLDWQSDGSAASGPWAPPIAILGETTTGNALQFTGAWAPALDGGTATPQGFPFIIYGTSMGTVMPISQAIEDLDNDLIPDHLGEIVTVQGVVFSPNYQSTNSSFYIDDGTAGVNFFLGGTALTLNLGDLIELTGEVSQFNGLTELQPADASGVTVLSSGNPLPDYQVLTLAQYLADPEAYEGRLVAFEALTMVGGTWPAGGSATVQMSDGVDTVDMRIDSDTDIDDNPEPTWPMDVVAIGNQFCSGGCVDHGYQILPRFYSDFMPPHTIPVELTSFTANVSNGNVLLNWSTATETNNLGFEVERRGEGEFVTVGFVDGNGTSTEIHNYTFTDNNLATGTYYYRLKQVDYDGSFEYSNVVEADVQAPVDFSLQQNYPNPFNPSTKISFGLAVDSKVTLKIFDVLGQEVTTLISSDLSAGIHQINFDASSINSGVYFYRIEANGLDGSQFVDVKKMILAK